MKTPKASDGIERRPGKGMLLNGTDIGYEDDPPETASWVSTVRITAESKRAMSSDSFLVEWQKGFSHSKNSKCAPTCDKLLSKIIP